MKSSSFKPAAARQVVAEFNGGTITSDGGVLLLKEVEAQRQISKQFAACFTDHRAPNKIEHTVEELAGQRVYGLALGYEDLNDHNWLRRDPLLAAAVGKIDPEGQERRREADRGARVGWQEHAQPPGVAFGRSGQGPARPVVCVLNAGFWSQGNRLFVRPL
jgi:hypothetical protein